MFFLIVEEEEEKEPEPEWEPFIPEEPSPILTALHGTKQGKVWLSMGEFDAGKILKTSAESVRFHTKL